MEELEVKFRNEATIKVQAQVFAGQFLVSTGLVEPGGVITLLAEAIPFDIYCKNSANGWEVARSLESRVTNIHLHIKNGKYLISEV